jgi:hypothetical protein
MIKSRHLVVSCCSTVFCALLTAGSRPCTETLSVSEATRTAAVKDGHVVCIRGWLPTEKSALLSEGLIVREIVPIGPRAARGKLDRIGIFEGGTSEYAKELYKPESFSKLENLLQRTANARISGLEVVCRGVLLYKRGLLRRHGVSLPPDPTYDAFRNSGFDVELVVLEIVSARRR